MNYTSIPSKDRPEPPVDKKMVVSILSQLSRAIIGNYEYYPKKIFNEDMYFFFWDFSLDEEGKYFVALSRIVEKLSKGMTHIKRLTVLEYTRETGETPNTPDCYFIRRFEKSYQKNVLILTPSGLTKASIS